MVRFLSLGEQPHCNSFIAADRLNHEEPCWPLNLLFCGDCHLVQLDCVVDPSTMFRNYVYVSGTTRTLREHFRTSASRLVSKFGLGPDALVVDIGSNDGSFLSEFRALGLRTFGVDPAVNIARIARDHGVETLNGFFGREAARNIRSMRGRALLVTAAGVFFHIDDMDDVCSGISKLLDDRGVLHVQAIYLGAMLDRISFDNIYHEHLSYYTLGPLVALLRRYDLDVFEVEYSPIHGGSLLVYACKAGAYPIGSSVREQLEYEHARGWDSLGPYEEFASRVGSIRDELTMMLRALKAQGRRIAAYGAPAKGNTLLNYCRIGTEILDYAAETAPLKIGLFTPGMHIPVIDEKEAMESPPDYFLLLPWNFAPELLEKNRWYRERGGKFIIPIPTPHVLQ